MGNQFVTKAEFARRVGVSSATATRLAQKRLLSAVSGGRIDMSHLDTVAYIAERSAGQTDLPPPAPGIASPQGTQARGTNAARETRKRESQAHLTDGIDTPDDIKEFYNMTLNEIITRFGTETAFIDWLKASKSIEDINEKRLKNAQTEGKLVSRDLIRIGVIEVIEAAHLKLLTDGAKTIARRVTAMNGSGRSLEDVEAFVVDNMSSHIRPVKVKTRKVLRDA